MTTTTMHALPLLLFSLVGVLDSTVAFAVGPAAAFQSRHRRSPLASYDYSPSTRTTSSQLWMAKSSYKLWDRLGIEEDEEPMWYLINCVATFELDLFRQCQAACADFPDDALKFAVPLEKKTRSHGANKMVTETKVKYPGYVFAKLRLCPPVYEAIQSLDLCRSWMGTINQKGYRKLPPVPVALNELEVENFGLEDLEDPDDDNDDTSEIAPGEDGIILDNDEEAEDEYVDPMYKGVDKKALKQYLGLKVEDMVKVTAEGKFHNEDGIVRRLKDGKIFVRFYTYGTMYEEWLEPSMVRKLTGEEILRGLAGPKQPVTQRDFDGPNVSSYGGGRYGGYNNDGDLRQSLVGSMRGGRGTGGGPPQQRSRRQDRVADRFRSGGQNDQQQRRNDRNWDWYKDQQQRKQGGDMKDGDWSIRSGSGSSADDNDGDWAQSNVDSQWGRRSQRQTRRDNNNYNRNKPQRHKEVNRQTEAAIDGKDDWSAFVSSTNAATGATGQKNDDADDFFSSLMSEMNKDLGSGNRGSDQKPSRSTAKSADSAPEEDFLASLMSASGNRGVGQKPSRSTATDADAASEDDFLASLMSGSGKRGGEQKPSLSTATSADAASEDDFFASLMSEMSQDDTKMSSPPGQKDTEDTFKVSQDDDFFANLESELGTALEDKKERNTGRAFLGSTAKSDNKDAEDFFSSLESELTVTNEKGSRDGGDDSADDFFASLEAELGGLLEEKPDKETSGTASPKQDTTDKVENFFSDSGTELRPTAETFSSNDDDKKKSSPGASAMNDTDLSKKTVPMLKDMLRERGLKVSGRKAELVERLLSS